MPSNMALRLLEPTTVADLRMAFSVIHVLHASTTLFLCEDRDSNELFVLKRIDKSTPQSTKPHDTTLTHELHVTRLLQARPHRHVVRVISTSEGRFATLVAMEHCVGGDLFSLLEAQSEGRFSEIAAVRLFRDIVSGVQHLHALGFAHRDLSLENTLIDADGSAKISDFRLSTPIGRVCCGSVGKPQYMAPEATTDAFYDPVVADIWSLGIVLFMLVTGSPLFMIAQKSDPAWRALERYGVAGILVQWGLGGRLSAATVEILSQMLQLDPMARVQSLDPVAARLDVLVTM